MRNLKRLAVLALTLVVLGGLLLPMTASAETPYVTYTVNGYGQIRQTQTAYLAYATITKFGEDVSLSAPSDICIASDGHMYIADTGNARIVVGTLDGEPAQSRIDEAVKTINREITRKLEEFGYIDSEGNTIEPYVIPTIDSIKGILGRN